MEGRKADGRPVLRFRSDGTFTVVQFTDVHWQNGDPKDQRTRRLMEQVLEAEEPDLVVFTGDMIESLLCDDPLRSLRQVVSVAEERAIPFAAVFGNHDSEKGSREALATVLEQEFRHSLFQRGPAEVTGVGNYLLPVVRAGGSEPAAILYFLDSGAYAPFRFGHYDWIRRDQVRWFRRQVHGVRESCGELPALAFFHIPLQEYALAWRLGLCEGTKGERVCCPFWNSGFFRAMRQAGNVVGAFCGHDHLNDYEGVLGGIRLCYGRATGYNTYGREEFPRGARVIRLMEGERRFATWLRLDDRSGELTGVPAS